MKVGIIGSGGREHALCLSIKKSPRVDKIYCFPGNAGTSDIAEILKLIYQTLIKLKNFQSRMKLVY